ncbi:MAG: hypothetical protein KGL39_41010 [Patescibacteria group bacterium]|nr:hypothetical protein [Patescibacteria group bacterium]
MIDTGKHHCLTPRCRGKVNKKKEHSPYCSKCRRLRWKEKFPLHYSFSKLKFRAAERGKEFALTRDEYISFAIKTDYARMKGKTSLSLSIDRVDNSRGYSADNIRAITLQSNSRRQFVPYFAHQIENESYQPTAEEIAAIEAQL